MGSKVDARNSGRLNRLVVATHDRDGDQGHYRRRSSLFDVISGGLCEVVGFIRRRMSV